MDGMYRVLMQLYNHNGEAGQNILNYDVTGTSPADDAYTTAQNLAAAFDNVIQTYLRPCLGTTTIIDYYDVRKFDSPGGPYYHYISNSLGTHPDDAGTFAQAADIRIKPGGRSSRSGHFFVCGIPNTAFVSGRAVSTYKTLLTTFATHFIAPIDLAPGTAQLGTWSREVKPPKPPAPAFFTPATDFEIASKATGLNKRTVPLI